MRYERWLRKFVLSGSRVFYRWRTLGNASGVIVRRDDIVGGSIGSNLNEVPLRRIGIMSTNVETLHRSRTVLREIFLAGVKAVSPRDVVRRNVKYENGVLHVAEKTFEIGQNVYIIGFGKAVMGMAIALEQILGDALKKGVVSVPSVSKDSMWTAEDMSGFPKLTSVINYREGAVNNQPDDRSLETTHEIIDLVESLGENDSLIVLISGGGSALLYMPRPIIDREDKLQLCKTLQNAGADIRELNTVRKKLSMVKGGGLARLAYPARVVSLILSDIVGDPMDLIASGPTVYSDRSSEEVVNILKKYNLYKTLESDLKTVVTCKETFNDAPLLTPTKQFKHVDNLILGNNTMAVESAAIEAQRKKLTPIILRSDVTGDVHEVSLAYVHVTNLICLALQKVLDKQEFYDKVKDVPILPLTENKVNEIYNLIENINGEGIVLIGGGEPTVVVKGSGKGGRNQELALYFSMDWLAKIKTDPRLAEYDVIMLSAGTDGQDGPTDATGAFGYPAIGPIIHEAYAKIKAKRVKDTELPRKTEEVKSNEETRDTCKVNVLSGYLSLKTRNLNDPVIVEEAVSNTESGEDLCQDTLALQTMEVERMLPENTLRENDTYNFYSRFKRGADLLKTGLTGTNVMDLHFVYIRKRSCSCKIDYAEGAKTESVLEAHDLHIDPETLEKYRMAREKSSIKRDGAARPEVPIKEVADKLNVKIIDDNLRDPCCRRDRKFPDKTLLKNKDFLL